MDFKIMNQKEAEAISKWHYDGQYSFYDADADEEDLAELMDPDQREHHYYVGNDKEQLIGFFTYHFNKQDKTITIGLGLAPEYTGKGHGANFIHEGLDFGKRLFPQSIRFKLSVATFNQRAIKVYKRMGFVIIGQSMVETNGGKYEFLHMEKTIEKEEK